MEKRIDFLSVLGDKELSFIFEEWTKKDFRFVVKIVILVLVVVVVWRWGLFFFVFWGIMYDVFDKNRP